MEAWWRFRIQDMTLPVLNAALRIRKTHGFSFWDCAIIAAGLALRCDRVFTEDLTHGQVVEGLAIIDPFRRPSVRRRKDIPRSVGLSQLGGARNKLNPQVIARRNCGSLSKCRSRVMRARSCSIATAAIHKSLSGTGVPARCDHACTGGHRFMAIASGAESEARCHHGLRGGDGWHGYRSGP